MYRKEWREGEWVVRYDGTETKIEIKGNPTLEELDDIITTLKDARSQRVKFQMSFETGKRRKIKV